MPDHSLTLFALHWESLIAHLAHPLLPFRPQSQEEFQEAIKRQMEEQMRVYHQMQSQSKVFTEMQALQFQQMADRQRQVGEGRVGKWEGR